jgi:hypothetical protein
MSGLAIVRHLPGVGQLDDELAAASFAGPSVDLATVGTHYACADGKTEARSIHTSALKGLEDPRAHFTRDSDASVEN